MPETIKKPRTSRTPAVHAVTEGAAVHAPKERKTAADLKVSGKYIEAVGRRKTSIARVRLFAGTGKMIVNGKAPLTSLKIAGEWDMTVMVSGGGIHAQAGAVRLGVARAIIKKNAEWKKYLRVLGFLTRDSRMVERKKYGLKKARRSPQWAKR
jgi:small subunit ribosomal protein S9